MHTPQTIAIIGATGKAGTAIAEALIPGNFRLLLFARDETRLKNLVDRLATKNPTQCILPFSCAYAAGWEADIIVFAVPFPAEQEIACQIKAVANQKIVVSLSGNCMDTLQSNLPHSKLVQLRFHENGQQAGITAHGQDAEALDTINEIIQSITYIN